MTTLVVLPDRVNTLLGLIESLIASEPFPYDGHVWAAKPLGWYGERLGICDRQVRRLITDLIKAKLVVKDQALGHDRKRVMVLRPGKEGFSRKQQQKLLAMILDQHRDRKHTPYEFGLCGCFVDTWGDKAPDYLKTVLKHWPEFCAVAKCGHVKYARWFETPADKNALGFLATMKHVVPDFVAEVQLMASQGCL